MTVTQSICDLAIEGVQQLVPYVPGKPIEELQRELGLSDIVKLASNENPIGPSIHVVEAVNRSLNEISRYPDGNGFQLKQVLSNKLAVSSDQVTLGNGSNEVLEIIARTFLSKDQEVVFSQHAFAVYPLVSQAIGATARVAKALDYGHDLDAMLQCVNQKTRLVFIANPNNPTGTLLDSGELKNFIHALPATTLCILDEAYFEYVDDNIRADSVAWLEQFPNLIITRTFSKAYGLAGLRVGYCLSSPLIADMLNRVREPFNNNMLALVAAEVALTDDTHLEQSIAVNKSGMQQLQHAFEDQGLSWIPSYGNFVTVNVGCEAGEIYQALLRKGVIVRPVANYEMPNHLRVSVGTEKENQIFIAALKQVLN